MGRNHLISCIITLLIVSTVSWFAGMTFAGQKTIRLATVEWEPHYGPNLKKQGYISEITREAFNRVGYDVEISFMPWKRAMHDTRRGHFDGLLGLYYTKDRESWVAYTDEISSNKIVFFSKKGRHISYSKLKDLRRYKIGIERGFTYGEVFDNASFLQKEPVRNIDINFNKLINGRVDLVAASEMVFMHMITTRHADARKKIEIVEPPLGVDGIYNGIIRKKKGWEQIISDFNIGLSMIRKDGTFVSILNSHGLK
ncbi:MAG: hypothetical protein D3926_01395 [Desulfobacteraceae bacterium]|nr:MAG: hypothetical protein D3926_01395 [Desulfobacteraceae bacterium]